MCCSNCGIPQCVGLSLCWACFVKKVMEQKPVVKPIVYWMPSMRVVDKSVEAIRFAGRYPVAPRKPLDLTYGAGI